MKTIKELLELEKSSKYYEKKDLEQTLIELGYFQKIKKNLQEACQAQRIHNDCFMEGSGASIMPFVKRYCEPEEIGLLRSVCTKARFRDFDYFLCCVADETEPDPIIIKFFEN